MCHPIDPMRAFHILLVEDDNDDVELLRDALDENDVPSQLQVIKDGGGMATYVAESGAVPDVIVMDFNLPKVHGREVLKAIKSNDAFKHVPVIILTTSSAPNDIDYSYKEGASRYFIKPTTAAGFSAVADAIRELAAKH